MAPRIASGRCRQRTQGEQLGLSRIGIYRPGSGMRFDALNIPLMTAGRIALFIILFFGFVVLYGLEVTYLGYYLERNRLLLTGLGLGLSAGILLAYLWVRRKQQMELYDRIRYSLAIGFAAILLFPLLLSLTNRWLSHDMHTVSVEFVGESPRHGSRFGVLEGEAVEPTQYFTFFQLDNRMYRISSSHSLFPAAREGERVSLKVRDGFWGFDYVAEQ